MDLQRFPWTGVGLSARTDMLQMAAHCRGCVRLRPLHEAALDAIARWGRAEGLEVAYDKEYLFLSFDRGTALLALRADQSPSPHETELGTFLGYPVCCTRAVASRGEEGIDEAALQAGTWTLESAFRLIDISGYLEGLSLLSHVPCSRRCGPSAAMAGQAAAWLRTTEGRRWAGPPWDTWDVLVRTIAAGDGPVGVRP